MKTHSKRFLSLTNQQKQSVKEIKPSQVISKRIAKEDFYLIDVREDNEWNKGHASGSIHLSKGTIERDIEKLIPNEKAFIILYCSGGFRSILAAKNLQLMGYSNVHSLESGAWQALD
jgi:rhodanese-related sulfurtransferase